MASRRYPTAELYEERERDFYRNGGTRSDRNYEELDLELRRGVGGPRSSAPDFFRDDYRDRTAGAMVVRGREDEFARGPRSAATFDDSRSVRTSRPPASVRERDDISIRHSEAPTRRAREVETDETDVVIRRREQSRPRTEFREVEREDIVFRRGDGPRTRSRPPPSMDSERDDVRFRGRAGGDGIDFHASRSEVNRNGRDISAERGSIRFQERDGKFELRANRREFSREGRDSSRERTSLTIRGRERSLPPPSRDRGELIAREREEFVVRRPRAESPPNPREVVRDEIIIRRKEERAPTPSPSPSPPPPPPPPAPEPEIRPPIIQEIITHHRHIDHGVVRARSPTPPPPSPPPPPPPVQTEEKWEIEINRRESRGGGRRIEHEELDIDINLDRSRSRGGEFEVKQRKKDMWTEITKDLVIREAIDSMGYSCEETDDFFYVMEYLQYEDVLHLVEISDRIRAKRKDRIREIEIERKSIHSSRPRSAYDEQFYEHEVSYDSRRSRYR